MMTDFEMKLFTRQAATTLAHMGRDHGLPVPDTAYVEMREAIESVLNPYLDLESTAAVPIATPVCGGSPDSFEITRNGYKES